MRNRNSIVGKALCGTLAALLACITISHCETSDEYGEILYSNGELLSGRLYLPPGKELRLHVDRELRNIPLSAVRHASFFPKSETMEKKWFFPEAGKTRKETYGDPFPVRHIRARIQLVDGSIATGHVYTTALYLDSESRTSKVILRAKQRGKANQSFAELAYPVSIAFPGRVTAATVGHRLAIEGAPDGDPAQLSRITWDAMARTECPPSADGTFRFSSVPGVQYWIGLRCGHSIAVGWPVQDSADAFDRVTQSLADVRDFFDELDLVNVCRDEANAAIYSLMMLSRKGHTTLARERNRPWRCEVWRWKESEDGRLMMAGRGYFFRGILAEGVAPPRVVASSRLWDDGSLTNRVLTWSALLDSAIPEAMAVEDQDE